MKTGLRKEIHITITLANSYFAIRVFIFLVGAYKRIFERGFKLEGKENPLDIKTGFTFIWRGDLAYSYSFYAGGKLQTLVFGCQSLIL